MSPNVKIKNELRLPQPWTATTNSKASLVPRNFTEGYISHFTRRGIGYNINERESEDGWKVGGSYAHTERSVGVSEKPYGPLPYTVSLSLPFLFFYNYYRRALSSFFCFNNFKMRNKTHPLVKLVRCTMANSV